jgi:hypothetical protein
MGKWMCMEDPIYAVEAPIRLGLGRILAGMQAEKK